MNREIYPAVLYPFVGDVLSQAGSPKVQVVGLQGVPIQTVRLDGGEVLEYRVDLGAWVPTLSVSDIHAEPLTDGNGNIIFAATMAMGGDVIVVVGVPN